MSSSVVQGGRLLANAEGGESGESSRESGIGDHFNDVDEGPTNSGFSSQKSEVKRNDHDDENYVASQGSGIAECSFGSSQDETKDEGACCLAPGSGKGDEEKDGSSSNSKDNVKDITGFDTASSQQRRRREALQWQRQRRDAILDKIRQLEDSAYSESETEDEMDFAESVRRTAGSSERCQTLEEIYEEDATSHKMEVAVPNKSRKKHSRSKRGKKQIASKQKGNISEMVTTDLSSKNVQPVRQSNRRPKFRHGPCRPMLSEWLLDRPEDFDEMWIGVICPVGKRVIVMASRGKTKIYSRSDEYLGTYRSLLPGGCRYNYRDPTTNRNRGVTILDCIWSEESQTFYVLDLICWNSHSCVNCDTDYRQFFLTSKFSENMELLERSPTNPFPFKPLPSFFAAETQLALWSTVMFPEKIDGIVFFHRAAFYTSETNPLCLWILLTQVESTLGVSVSPEMLSRQQKVKNMNSRRRQQQLKMQNEELEYQNEELEYQDGELEYQDGELEYQDGELEYQDGELEYQDGELEYQNEELEYQNGELEYPNEEQECQNQGVVVPLIHVGHLEFTGEWYYP